MIVNNIANGPSHNYLGFCFARSSLDDKLRAQSRVGFGNWCYFDCNSYTYLQFLIVAACSSDDVKLHESNCAKRDNHDHHLYEAYIILESSNK